MNDDNALYKILGELSADMKHVLSSLKAHRADTDRLREDMEQEMTKLNERLSKVEKFNTKVIAYASVLLPVLMIVLQWGIPTLLLWI